MRFTPLGARHFSQRPATPSTRRLSQSALARRAVVADFREELHCGCFRSPNEGKAKAAASRGRRFARPRQWSVKIFSQPRLRCFRIWCSESWSTVDTLAKPTVIARKSIDYGLQELCFLCGFSSAFRHTERALQLARFKRSERILFERLDDRVPSPAATDLGIHAGFHNRLSRQARRLLP